MAEDFEQRRSLLHLCVESATRDHRAVETWRRQRRSLERLPSQVADFLLRRLLHRRLLFPSLLEVFKYSAENIDLSGESSVDAEWMAYIGAFRYLQSLNVSDCHRLNNAALWSLSGMDYLKELNLSRCSKVGDAGIKHLLSIQTMENLCISETSVSVKGITLLSSFRNLITLDLGGLYVDDQALDSLKVLKELQYLDLWGSKVTNQGTIVLTNFPKLSFLNIAWTIVTKLPNLPSLIFLNMSNCRIASMLKGDGDKARLRKLIVAGASFVDPSEAFSYFETHFLNFLDASNSSLKNLSFLCSMYELEHLDLSGCSVGDDAVEMITPIGEKLRFLNLSNTRVSSSGVGILAGHVPNLETLSLSCTSIDDLSISFIGMITSLKALILKNTNIRGLFHQQDAEPEWVPSLSALQNIDHLERLDLEETQLKDEALYPLSSLKELRSLSLRRSFLTDSSLYLLSAIPKLINLSIRDAVLTDAGLNSFNPPPMLKVLDLIGCWLLTKDMLLSFSRRHPQIEVRHELILPEISDHDNPGHPSSSQGVSKASHLSRLPVPSLVSETSKFLDQRLKYSRDELLSLQFASPNHAPLLDDGTAT